MAIQFVGGVKGSAVDGGNVVLDLTALTGGLASSPSENDLVLLSGGSAGGGTVSLPGDYTLTAINFTATKVGRKAMGATPDTSVTVTGSGNANHGTAAIAFVFRGVCPVTPEDATATTTTGSSTNPDPPSITTVTDNAAVIAGANSTANDTSITAPSGYGSQFDIVGDDTNDITIGLSWKAVAAAGAENPAAWTGWSTGGWRSFSIALRADNTGALSRALGALAPAGATSLDIDAALSRTLGALTQSASATLGLDATLSRALASLALAMSGSVDIDAALSRMLAALTIDADAASADAEVQGSLARTLESLRLSGLIERQWEPQSAAAANWSAQTSAAGSWSSQSSDAATWTPQSGSTETWSTQ
jgi:hypothetical protein